MSETGRYEFTKGARLDLIWFVKFLERFNGTALIRSQFVHTVTILVDACLIGAGSIWKGTAFCSYKWPDFVLGWNVNINELELFNVVVTIRKWKEKLQGKTILVLCDNKTSVMSLFSGKTKNDFMAACLREMWYLASTNDMFIKCEHIAGSANNEADLLSRAFNGPHRLANL